MDARWLGGCGVCGGVRCCEEGCRGVRRVGMLLDGGRECGRLVIGEMPLRDEEVRVFPHGGVSTYRPQIGEEESVLGKGNTTSLEVIGGVVGKGERNHGPTPQRLQPARLCVGEVKSIVVLNDGGGCVFGSGCVAGSGCVVGGGCVVDGGCVVSGGFLVIGGFFVGGCIVVEAVL